MKHRILSYTHLFEDNVWKIENQEKITSVQSSRHYTRADVFQTANTHRVSHCTQRTGQNVVERYSIYIPYSESLRRLSKTRG